MTLFWVFRVKWFFLFFRDTLIWVKFSLFGFDIEMRVTSWLGGVVSDIRGELFVFRKMIVMEGWLLLVFRTCIVIKVEFSLGWVLSFRVCIISLWIRRCLKFSGRFNRSSFVCVLIEKGLLFSFCFRLIL